MGINLNGLNEDGDNLKRKTIVSDLFGFGKAVKAIAGLALILIWADCWGCDSLDKVTGIAHGVRPTQVEQPIKED